MAYAQSPIFRLSHALEPSEQRFELADTLTDLVTGRTIAPAELQGKVVLFDFWATWCSPCLTEIPRLNELERSFGGDEFILLGISVDGITNTAIADSVRATAMRHGITYAVIYDDAARSLMKQFGITGLPSKRLLNEEGIFMRSAGANSPEISDAVGVVWNEVYAYLAGRFPPGHYTRPEGDTVGAYYFSSDGTYTVTQGENVVIRGEYVSTSSHLIMMRETGSLACEGDIAGIYQWNVSSARVRLFPVEDECRPRRADLGLRELTAFNK